MRQLYQFVKSTLFGGLLILVPLIVLGAVAAWAISAAVQTATPVVQWLPDKSIAGVSLLVVVIIGGLIAICFLAGLFAETALLRFFGDRAERIAMSIPGYALMKSVGADFVGVHGKTALTTVLVRFEASWQLGFQMETLADGRVVVFIPGVPRALVGTLHIVSTDRVERLDLSVSAALDALGRLGVGLGEIRLEKAAGETAGKPANMA